MTNVPSSGIEPGQRRLNGPQTTGREYRNLSQPTHTTAQDDDVVVPRRDGVSLLADVHRPAEPGRYPVPIAAYTQKFTNCLPDRCPVRGTCPPSAGSSSN